MYLSIVEGFLKAEILQQIIDCADGDDKTAEKYILIGAHGTFFDHNNKNKVTSQSCFACMQTSQNKKCRAQLMCF